MVHRLYPKGETHHLVFLLVFYLHTSSLKSSYNLISHKMCRIPADVEGTKTGADCGFASRQLFNRENGKEYPFIIHYIIESYKGRFPIY